MYQDARPCRLVTTAFWKPAGCGTDVRAFDGYKSHFSVDPDEELITNVAVTAANSADRYVIDKLLDPPATGTPAAGRRPAADELAAHTGANSGSDSQAVREPKDFEAYSDSAYAEGATPDKQTARGHDMRTKVPPVRNANGLSKDEFSIDLAAGTVTCPARHTVAIGSGRRHPVARFGRFWGWGWLSSQRGGIRVATVMMPWVSPSPSASSANNRAPTWAITPRPPVVTTRLGRPALCFTSEVPFLLLVTMSWQPQFPLQQKGFPLSTHSVAQQLAKYPG